MSTWPLPAVALGSQGREAGGQCCSLGTSWAGTLHLQVSHLHSSCWTDGDVAARHELRREEAGGGTPETPSPGRPTPGQHQPALISWGSCSVTLMAQALHQPVGPGECTQTKKAGPGASPWTEEQNHADLWPRGAGALWETSPQTSGGRLPTRGLAWCPASTGRS